MAPSYYFRSKPFDCQVAIEWDKQQLQRQESIRQVLVWQFTLFCSIDQNFANQEALLNAFGSWEPEEGMTVLAFVSRLDTDSGYVLVEADDPKVIASFVSKYIYWNDVEVIPVVDVEEIVPINSESLAWARAASSS